ncbi:MAG: hypothetical protein ACLGHT_08230 [Acidimicrobiia bacterium]
MPSEPTGEEMAAIVAAIEVAWPRPAPATALPEPPIWRWSGRWWLPRRPVAANRQRP